MDARRMADFALYIAIGIAFAAAVLWTITHFDLPDGFFVKWGGLVGNTALVFGYTIRYFAPSFKRPTFWAVLFLLLLTHLGLLIPVLGSVRHWQASWWMLLDLIEMAVILAVLFGLGHRFGQYEPRKVKRGLQS